MALKNHLITQEELYLAQHSQNPGTGFTIVWFRHLILSGPFLSGIWTREIRPSTERGEQLSAWALMARASPKHAQGLPHPSLSSWRWVKLAQGPRKITVRWDPGSQ